MRAEELMNFQNTVIPKIGDKCTMHLWSDSHACQVTRVSKSGKTVWIQRNITTVDPSKENDMGHQNWVLHENEFEGCEMRITKRKDGKWRESRSDTLVVFGQWHEYYDWEF